MAKYIDRLAYIYLKNKQVLVVLAKGENVWYTPGGKREKDESDIQALMREAKEELSINLKPETIRLHGVFEAQAFGKPEGTIVRMTCYRADYTGEIVSDSEIEAVDYFSYKQKSQVGFVGQLLFDNLYEKGLIK